ncbi:MAG: DNA recombination protein RmuC [Steroidobacteraceae bacterium]
MTDTWLLIAFSLTALFAGALGFLGGRLREASRVERMRGELEAARARLEAQLQSEQAQLALLEQSEQRLRVAFDDLASDTLRNNSELFLRMARETLTTQQQAASGTLREREAAVQAMLDPIRSALEKTEAQVASLERERRDAFTQLRTQIESLASGQAQLGRETRNLVTALRRPEVRGRWGEVTLRRVVELAGLTEHYDFSVQVQRSDDDSTLRPDLVVHMPDARELVIDAKTPLDAYLEALECEDDDQRRGALQRHASQVAQRVSELGAKRYWASFERSPEFVVLFLPGDQFLSAALTVRPELIEDAMRRNVVLATPSTLIALLKAVAFGWRQVDVAKNAETIRQLGQELYARLGKFTQNLSSVGDRLQAAVDSYNRAVGSLERKVLPQARRFSELGATAESALDEPAQIDKQVRAPRLAADDARAVRGDESADD